MSAAVPPIGPFRQETHGDKEGQTDEIMIRDMNNNERERKRHLRIKQKVSVFFGNWPEFLETSSQINEVSETDVVFSTFKSESNLQKDTFLVGLINIQGRVYNNLEMKCELLLL